MPAGNDFCNNQILNAAWHVTDSDEGRGVPALGKLVFDTRDSAVYLCTSTSPDPTENGGGTWLALN